MDANVYRCMIKLRRGLRNRKRLFLIFPPHSTIDAAVQIDSVDMNSDTLKWLHLHCCVHSGAFVLSIMIKQLKQFIVSS